MRKQVRVKQIVALGLLLCHRNIFVERTNASRIYFQITIYGIEEETK